ncbi:hypothetical protein Sango_2920200 [Sesamum angolense]|uniref:CCHC-type domain-containing protein n=1 Tax=Sesamum angolense TaxID=2727404 RepID=A0AAE1T5M2_9LAMI|nr:hypothetical protein Sango_2920200 [Sesamum angolense]
MERCPWAFDKCLLVLAKIDGSGNPKEIDLNCCVFHVLVHDLPLRKITRDIAELIGNQIGKFIDVDMEDKAVIWGFSLRIRVALNVNKPLQRVLKLCTTLGDQKLISFTYGRLPNYCYLCGHLGHISKQCDVQFQEGFVDPGENTPFGPWLRAPTQLLNHNYNHFTLAQPHTPSALPSLSANHRKGSDIFSPQPAKSTPSHTFKNQPPILPSHNSTYQIITKVPTIIHQTPAPGTPFNPSPYISYLPTLYST